MRYIAMLMLLLLGLGGCHPSTPQPPDYVPKPTSSHIGCDTYIDTVKDSIAAASPAQPLSR